MDKEKAKAVTEAYWRCEAAKDILKKIRTEIRVMQCEAGFSGVVTLTVPASWLTDLAILANRDIERYESEIEKL